MSQKQPFNLIIIVGPPASGKMTVGQELQKLTVYKLFYNHLSLELTNQFFDFGTPDFSALDRQIRFDVFRAIADSGLPGLIFTLVWAFSEPEDEKYVEEIIGVFRGKELKICLVELVCDQEERLKRNRTENRTNRKPSKRDLDFSERLLLKEDQLYRMNSREGEFPEREILRIDNTRKSAQEVAEMIVDHYAL